MADEDQNTNAENNDVVGGSSAQTGGDQSDVKGWAGPSQEDWENLRQSNEAMQSELRGYREYFQEPEPELPEELDLSDPYTMAALINQIVEQRLSQVTPYVRSAAQDQGKRQMEEMFGELEKEVGSFDHGLAERTAFYFFDQTGDAEKSVTEAAKYAAEVRKTERDTAESELKTRATRSGRGATEEPATRGSAVPGEEPARSYDEVIDRWTHQTEV